GENRQMGEIFARKANAAKGETRFIIPMKGYSMLDSVNEKQEPQVFWDPKADKSFVDALKNSLDPSIRVIEVDANINDAAYAEMAVAELLEMIEQHQKKNQ